MFNSVQFERPTSPHAVGTAREASADTVSVPNIAARSCRRCDRPRTCTGGGKTPWPPSSAVSKTTTIGYGTGAAAMDTSDTDIHSAIIKHARIIATLSC